MLNIYFELLPAGLMQSLILSLVAFGVMLAFRFINFADLSAEGSYAFGGVIVTILLLNHYPPVIAVIIASLASGLIGIGTALIHLKFKINSLLAGIIMSSIAYSINLKLLKQPNVPLFDLMTLTSNLKDNMVKQIIFLLIVNLIVIMPIYFYFLTEKGLKFRAAGINPSFAEKQGININRQIMFGLFLSNAIIGFAGTLIVQLQNYVDITMGMGIIINSLAAVLIGESIISNDKLINKLLSPLLGAVIYQQIQGFAMSIGLEPSDLKLFSGIIILTIIALTKKRI